MSIRIFVKDRNNRVAPKVEVFIKWKGGGTSRGRTGDNGVYDTGINSTSTIDYVQVDGRGREYTGVLVRADETLNCQISRSVS